MNIHEYLEYFEYFFDTLLTPTFVHEWLLYSDAGRVGRLYYRRLAKSSLCLVLKIKILGGP
jgi:hypothetical protein